MIGWFKKKRIPDLIPIMRMEDYHTHYLGQCNDGRLFWGYETFVFAKSYFDLKVDEDWRPHRNEYLVLHTFDKKGNYLETKHWLAGTTAESDQSINDAKLNEMISDLGEVKFKNIKVKTFQTIIDGEIFGLISNEEDETVDLQPSSTISFQEPWDGEYYT